MMEINLQLTQIYIYSPMEMFINKLYAFLKRKIADCHCQAASPTSSKDTDQFEKWTVSFFPCPFLYIHPSNFFHHMTCTDGGDGQGWRSWGGVGGGGPGAPAQSVRPQTGRSWVQSPAGS